MHGGRDILKYSISEEVQGGTFVGNIAKDLGLDKNALKNRGYRIVAGSTETPFEVNENDGILYLKSKIDREEVCERISPCLINLKTVLENPLEIHYVSVEILDVNDHSPVFPEKEKKLEISESALPGARFQLQAARDPDVGQFSIQQYKLSHNEHFRIEVKDRGEDRKFQVVATDSGTPSLSSNVTVNVFILDQNDNAPVILYPLSSNGSAEGVEEIPRNVNAGHLFQVVATDSGTPSLSSNVTVNVFILDQNDNAPVILYPLSSNGSAEDDGVLYVSQKIDREKVCSQSSTCLLNVKTVLENPLEVHYVVVEVLDFQVVATDSGTPSLSSNVTVNVFILDQNDNAPVILYPLSSNGSAEGVEEIPRNVNAGHLFQVVATDSGTPSLSSNVTVNVFILDQNDNAPVILYPLSSNGSAEGVEEIPRNVNAGHLFRVVATDSGTPSLSSNVTVNVFILDQNDNAPVILYPLSSNGSAEGVEEIPRNVNAGHLFQVVATDSGTPSLSSNVTVNVFILDQNDNAPVILYPLSSNGSAEGSY
ncbi:protocadherin gamma-C3-like [Xiphophorus hellerii]|uniref:protocadherin gamma-C3-like n=1 Tax=Xiphophorus hellerii TaxID=8084 RepID=UPI0013B3B9E8|nr:protocadherin gamma-C3-like [Xiphophorus hellerii]